MTLTVAVRGVAQDSDCLAVFKTGDYKTAIPLLRASAAQETGDSLTAALLSALAFEGQMDEALTVDQKLAAREHLSADATTARGEFAFISGDVMAAERLFRMVLKAEPDHPRALLGMHRIFNAESNYKSARLLCLRAHELEPNDALITLAFLHYAVGERREQLAGPFLHDHPWFAPQVGGQRARENSEQLRTQLKGKQVFEPAELGQPVTLPLSLLRDSPTSVRGLGLDVAVNGKVVHLLFDTGASGILLSQQAAAHLGVELSGSTSVSGVGDSGPRQAAYGMSNECAVGGLRMNNCVFEGLTTKPRIAGSEDGLVGANIFSEYLVHIDFDHHQLRLTPQPVRAESSQGYDRTIPPGEERWEPVYRFGHLMCVRTQLNRKSWGLFAIDTGAGMVLLDSTFARLSTKVRSDSSRIIRGVAGNVKEVSEADKAELRFSHFAQQNVGILCVDVNGAKAPGGVRYSGFFGLPLLALFNLDIDYRNGLVNFNYRLK